MKRKLLYVVNVDHFFISHRLPIALTALQKGYEVHVATSFSSGMERLQSLGFIVHSLDLDRRSTSISSNLRTFFSILHVFKKIRPHVVHLVSIKPVLLGGIAARLAAVPFVVAAVSGLGFVFIARSYKATILRLLVGCFYRLAFSHKRLIAIFQNEDDRAQILKISHLPEDRARLIAGSGVNLNAYSSSPPPEGLPVVVLVARLYVEKGVREFIEAARLIRESGTAARFVVLGNVDTDNPAAISYDEINQWVSEGVIEWWGHRNDIPQILAAANMVVLPSYREGLSKALAEAAAAGRAVVTTDVPGCRDAIEPGITGLLVPVREVKPLAAAIKYLLDNPAICKEMGLAGRELAARSFDVKQVISQHMRIYEELF